MLPELGTLRPSRSAISVVDTRPRARAQSTTSPSRAPRYDLNLWIADLFEGATYLPR